MCSKTIYNEAILVQDASNIIAVSKLLSDVTLELRHDDFLGSRELTEHPAVVLIVSKLSTMVDTDNLTVYCDAYQECKELGEEK